MTTRPTVIAWAALVALSLVSFGWASGVRGAATAFVLSIAAAKALTIGWRFMDLSGAPRSMQWIFAGWALSLSAALTVWLHLPPSL
jgi:Prokaryotic Cytochrome C oxidase subunit IV